MRLLFPLCLAPLVIITTYYLIRVYVKWAKSITSDKNAVVIIVLFMTVIHLILAFFMMWG